MRNKRLKKLIGSRGGELNNGTFIDCYNQQLFQDFAPTITTRINSSSHYYVSVFTENDMERTKLNRYVWYCYRKYEKKVGTDKAQEDVSRIFDITVVEKERIKESESETVTIQADAMQKVFAILNEWGMRKQWMSDLAEEYISKEHPKENAIRFLSDITPIRKAIRKQTPTECFRLMDVEEDDIKKLLNSGISNSRLYQLAGNSIVVACMEGIFYNLFSNEEVVTGTLF